MHKRVVHPARRIRPRTTWTHIERNAPHATQTLSYCRQEEPRTLQLPYSIALDWLRRNNQGSVHAFAAGFVVVWGAVEGIRSRRVCRKQCKAIAVAWHRDVQVQFIHI